jgi:hypothetical protein
MRQQSRQPDRGPVGRIKELLSLNISLKRESGATALNLAEQRAKGSPPEKNTTSRKSYSLFLCVTLQMGEVEVDDDEMSENHLR